MDAMKLLEQQHDEVTKLFAKLEDARGGERKKALCNEISDALAAHATIEEKIFYPAAYARLTDDILHESLEEHLGIKRFIADLLDMTAADEMFDAKVKVLKEQVQHHVEEERDELFPKVRKLLDADQLEALGQEMQSMFEELRLKQPRRAVPAEIDKAASLR